MGSGMDLLGLDCTGSGSQRAAKRGAGELGGADFLKAIGALLQPMGMGEGPSAMGLASTVCVLTH